MLTEDYDTVPAFTCRLSGDEIFQDNELISFDLELTNQGGYYQTDNSIFICPYDGVYAFFLNTLSQNGYLLTLQLFINDQQYFGTYADNVSGAFNQASNTFVGFCGAGSQVWVRVG